MKKILMKLILIIILTYGFNMAVLAENTGQELIIDFGLVKAFEPIVKNQNFLLPAFNSQINGALIEANSGLMNQQTLTKIPLERISLLIGEKVLPVSSSPVETIWSEIVTSESMVGRMNFEFRPIDYPGDYEGIIVLKFWKVDQSNPSLKIWLAPIKLWVKVQIEPWIRLQTDQNTPLKLEPALSQTDKNIQNTEPLIINVASNTHWTLFVELQTITWETPAFDLPCLITMNSNSNLYQGIQQLLITVGDGKKIIATGAPTVKAQQYWCEISFIIELRDFIKYPAGLYNFGINFRGTIRN